MDTYSHFLASVEKELSDCLELEMKGDGDKLRYYAHDESLAVAASEKELVFQCQN